MPRSVPFRPRGLATSLVALLLAASPALTGRAIASDHGDTAENIKRIGADLTDVYIFPSPASADNVVIVLNSHGLILPAQGTNVGFDPGVLYQMKIDTTGDYVEDLVIQFKFLGTGPSQRVVVSGPSAPVKTGTTTVFGVPHLTTGLINQQFSPSTGVTVFAGLRADPFFLDLERFYEILPDRVTPLTGTQINFPTIKSANTPRTMGFRGFPAGAPGSDSNPGVRLPRRPERPVDRRRIAPLGARRRRDPALGDDERGEGRLQRPLRAAGPTRPAGHQRGAGDRHVPPARVE